MTPPPIAPPRSLDHNCLPLAASNAYRFPPMSPNRTNRPVVGVTPPISGNGAWNCHLRSPVSASLAVIQPDHNFGSSCLPKPSVAPLHGLPAGALPRVFTAVAFIVVPQSTPPVSVRSCAGSNAGPFCSTLPCATGQNRFRWEVLVD